MSIREELTQLLDSLPDDDLAAVLNVVRRSKLPQPQPRDRSWPPAWVGSGPKGVTDMSQRVDEVLAEGFGR